jgi:hypothetical protein
MKRPILRKNALHSTGFYRKFHLQLPKSQSTCKPVRHVLITFILLFGATSSEAKWNVVIHDSRRYVPMEDVAAFYKMNMPATSTDRFRLEAPGRKIERGQRPQCLHQWCCYALCFPIVAR